MSTEQKTKVVKSLLRALEAPPLLDSCDEAAHAVNQIRILSITAANCGLDVQQEVLEVLFRNLEAHVASMKSACGLEKVAQ